MRPLVIALCATALLVPAACDRLKEVGRPPSFKPVEGSNAYYAMTDGETLPMQVERRSPLESSSLWSHGRQSLLGDHRAGRRGDILTVVIEIDEKAEISNSTSRSRSGATSMGIPQMLGIPQRINKALPDGVTMDNAVEADSSSSHSGDGSVKRKEKLTLRIAATVTDVLNNGVMKIEGSQEVRVNFEMRELLVSGYVRPEDISRQNEITYDKIAAARISYGGRGQIMDVQQPRIGHQIADIVLPF
ncbi:MULTISPECIES: flagellar basal body L-ring protein FlgH [Rhodovulum]|uniref:Flagellar L-ring protein n=2 Tax=Rhodovulum TaxID=34008 RepID=A0A8E2VIF3_9RHOB|nr:MULTISPECIES: flagellar basal body L-ring protein FlgH [Rhodovulum]PTW47660.1 flagellar L-ring protein precursor FlgH [Rhodovulum kholense]RAP41626.1 flagellar basal body L-ring protein [Rhodovulum viride]